MYLTLADLQAFLNFVNGNLGKKWYTDEPPTSVSAGKKLITTGVGLGSEAVDDISYALGLSSDWDMSTALPPSDYAVGTRHIISVGGTYNTIAAEVGDIVEWYSPSLFFVYPLATTLVRLPTLDNYATKTYVEGLVAGLLDDRGSYDPTITSAYPTSADNGSGVDGAVLKGDIWFFSADGIVGTKTVKTGYSVRALEDDPGQDETKWDILNVGLGYIPENVANKILSSGDLNTATDDQYASALLLKNLLALKANKANETHTGAMRVPSTLKIYDVVDDTKEALFNVSNITPGQARTITVPDRNVTLGELPPFTPNTNYKAFSSIYDNNRLMIAKVDFTSGLTLVDSDWYIISGSSAKYIISASQVLEANAEYFLGTDTTATLTFDIPDPQVVPPNSTIKIHRLEMQGDIDLVQTAGWLPTSFGFAAPPYSAPSATVSISPLVRYTTTLTSISLGGFAYWVVQHQAGDWLTEPTLVNPADYSSQVVFKMDNVTLGQQRMLYMADADMDLANLLEAATYTPKVGTLTLSRTGTPLDVVIKRPVVYLAAGATLECNTDYHLLTTTGAPTAPMALIMPNYADIDDSGSIHLYAHQFDGEVQLSVGDGSQSGFLDEHGNSVSSIYVGVGSEVVITPTKDGSNVVTWRVQTSHSKYIPVGDNGMLLVKDTDTSARLRLKTNAASGTTREATFPDANLDFTDLLTYPLNTTMVKLLVASSPYTLSVTDGSRFPFFCIQSGAALSLDLANLTSSGVLHFDADRSVALTGTGVTFKNAVGTTTTTLDGIQGQEYLLQRVGSDIFVYDKRPTLAVVSGATFNVNNIFAKHQDIALLLSAANPTVSSVITVPNSGYYIGQRIVGRVTGDSAFTVQTVAASLLFYAPRGSAGQGFELIWNGSSWSVGTTNFVGCRESFYLGGYTIAPRGVTTTGRQRINLIGNNTGYTIDLINVYESVEVVNNTTFNSVAVVLSESGGTRNLFDLHGQLIPSLPTIDLPFGSVLRMNGSVGGIVLNLIKVGSSYYVVDNRMTFNNFAIFYSGTNQFYTKFNMPTELTGNRVVILPNADVDLGKIPASLTLNSANGVLTLGLTDTTSLSASFEYSLLNQVALTSGSGAVVLTATQPSTRYAIIGTANSNTFDFSAWSGTGKKYIEVQNNVSGLTSNQTVVLQAGAGDTFLSIESTTLSTGGIATLTLLPGETIRVARINGATAFRVARFRPEVRNIHATTGTVTLTSGYKVTNLVVGGNVTISGSISSNTDEILRIFALGAFNINFGSDIFDARTGLFISSGSYTLYAGQVLEVTKSANWLLQGGHIQDENRFAVFKNGQGIAVRWSLSGMNVNTNVIMPSRDVDLGQVGITSWIRLTPSDGGSITLSSGKLYHTFQPSGGIATFTFVLPSSPVDGDVIEVHDRGNNFAATTTLTFRSAKTFLFPNGVGSGGGVSGVSPNIEWLDTRRANSKCWKFTYYSDFSGFWMVEEFDIGSTRSPDLSSLKKANSTVGLNYNIDSITGTNKVLTYPNRNVDVGKLLPLDQAVTYTLAEQQQGQRNLGLSSTGNTTATGNFSLWCENTILNGSNNTAIHCRNITVNANQKDASFTDMWDVLNMNVADIGNGETNLLFPRGSKLVGFNRHDASIGNAMFTCTTMFHLVKPANGTITVADQAGVLPYVAFGDASGGGFGSITDVGHHVLEVALGGGFIQEFTILAHKNAGTYTLTASEQTKRTPAASSVFLNLTTTIVNNRLSMALELNAPYNSNSAYIIAKLTSYYNVDF